MSKLSTKELVYLALMTGLVAVATMVVQIPVTATGGYLNFGDTIIFVSALVFGPVTGLVAGGIGSAMADILSGYGVWAPFTLVVKGLEGLICGYLFLMLRRKAWPHVKAGYLACAVAALWMVIGYLGAGTILAGSVVVAMAEIPANLVQGGVSVVVAVLLRGPIQRIAQR